MKFLKFLVVVIAFFGISVFIYGYLADNEVIVALKEYYNKTPSELINNEYRKEIDESFVHYTDNFVASDKQELLNIYYTIMSSGMNEFTFYCDSKYIDCIKEVEIINSDSEILSQINNFVHVFNSFKTIKTTYTSSGKIILTINRVYNEEDIKNINNELDKIENEIIDKNKSNYDNILSIHDYIVNTTKYNLEDENKVGSSNAKELLFDHKATCNGYTDTIALLLDRLNIKNVKISNDNHIWNLVYLDGKWLHLDATWDDPVNSLNKDLLLHDYFLKETKEMDEKHNYNKEIFNFIN